jgi:hypothetical protein
MDIINSIVAALALSTSSAPAAESGQAATSIPAMTAATAATATTAPKAARGETVYCVIDLPTGTYIRRTYCMTAKQWRAANMELPSR